MDESTATVGCAARSAAALTNGFTAFPAARFAGRRAALRSLRFGLRTAAPAFTRADALRTLTLRRTAVFLRATFRRTADVLRATLRRTERRLRSLERRRAAFFGFFLAAMTVLQKFPTPTRAPPMATPRLQARLVTGHCQRPARKEIGGAEGDRTLDLRIANATLSQLSYVPRRPEIVAMPPQAFNSVARGILSTSAIAHPPP